MRQKSIRKMTLQKITVANLGNVKMGDVKGGTRTGITCVYCNSDHSCINDDFHCIWFDSCEPTCGQLN